MISQSKKLYYAKLFPKVCYYNINVNSNNSNSSQNTRIFEFVFNEKLSNNMIIEQSIDG